TNRRLLAAEGDPAAGPGWHSWPLGPDAALRVEERGGVGTLDFTGPAGRHAHWRYTAGRSAAAHRLVQRLASLRAAPPGGAVSAGEPLAPGGGAGPRPENGQCPACAPPPTAPSVSALFRLARFSRARAGLIVLGFLITLASTTAGLVPPYLTMPLLDKVLIP